MTLITFTVHRSFAPSIQLRRAQVARNRVIKLWAHCSHAVKWIHYWFRPSFMAR